MIEHTIDARNAILHLRPTSTLSKDDFTQLTEAVDSYIEANGDLAGIIIDAPEFPGWDSFAAMTSHFRFVRDHHQHIRRVALVTGSPLANVAEALASHFVSAEIRHFAAGELDAARQWIMDQS